MFSQITELIQLTQCDWQCRGSVQLKGELGSTQAGAPFAAAWIEVLISRDVLGFSG